MKADIKYIIGKQLIKLLKEMFAQFLATTVNNISLKVHSIRAIEFSDYINNGDETMVSMIRMDPLKDLILIEIKKDLLEPILYYACNGLPESYKTGCNTAKEITDIDISIMEAYIVRMLGCLRESFTELLDLRPILNLIETSLKDIYDRYIDFRSVSGTLVEVIIDFNGLWNGKLNFFYPENTIKQLLEIGEKNESN